MSTLKDISTLLDSTGDLYHKFRGGIIKQASVVYNESQSTANHVNRLSWAKDVLLNGNIKKRTEEMYRLGLTNASVVSGGDSTADSDIEWVVAFFLDTVSGG